MSLIKSISGIRGTIGGKPGEGLSPMDIVRFTSAFASFLRINHSKDKLQVVVGRDARISGHMVNQIVTGTLMGMGVNVIDIGLTTTPTAEIAVVESRSQGGIILTASHNPKQWNALKLLNSKGEFLSEADGTQLLTIADEAEFSFAGVMEIMEYIIEKNDRQGLMRFINELFQNAPDGKIFLEWCRESFYLGQRYLECRERTSPRFEARQVRILS